MQKMQEQLTGWLVVGGWWLGVREKKQYDEIRARAKNISQRDTKKGTEEHEELLRDHKKQEKSIRFAHLDSKSSLE